MQPTPMSEHNESGSGLRGAATTGHHRQMTVKLTFSRVIRGFARVLERRGATLHRLSGAMCGAVLVLANASAWAGSVVCACTREAGGGLPGVSVTAATGGASISADNAGTTNWTTLTGPVPSENNPGGIGTGTLILTIPSGFQLNTANAVTVSVVCSGSGSNMVTSSPATLSGNTITTTVSAISSGGK